MMLLVPANAGSSAAERYSSLVHSWISEARRDNPLR